MSLFEGKIIPVGIEEQMRTSYLRYAMSVIIDRALPDVRDGLKPVQRRILYSMSELGMRSNRPHRKSARIVGEVIGKYHPHGDSAIYDAMVRMAQDFNYRYMLVDGHGNFGSIDGDPAAAMRYTEARLTRFAEEMLRDLDKDTVNFIPNFDDTLEQPEVLPARVPNLLVNGASGIAVGMATNIPPHNLGEIVDGLVMLIDNPDASIKDLQRVIKGPDFPTGGLILGREGIDEAYATGRGRIQMRARVQLEQMSNGKTRIVVTELPYMVNKANLIEKIAELVRDKRIDGITDLKDESDRDGLRVTIEIRRDTNPHIVLNHLYKHTQLQDTFGVIMLALVDGQPKVLNLKEVLEHYLQHQREVVTRRTRFELRKAEERAHILEGYRIALDNLDEIINLIRKSATDQEAKEGLMTRFGLTEKQAVAILDMQLRRLTGLERDKIESEYAELLKKIARYKEILADIKEVDAIIRDELLEVKEKFGDARRTEITGRTGEIEIEDLIADEDIVVTLTHQGYIKRMPVSIYRNQRRGGRGVTALTTREEDFVEHLFITSTHSHIVFFTNKGKMYRLKGYDIPEAGRQARGVALINLIPIEPGEKVQAVYAVKDYGDGEYYVVMATKMGKVKKTALDEFNSPRAGLIGIVLEDGDELIGVRLTQGNEEILLVTKQGMSIRFSETEVRPMGRATMGVKGITLNSGDEVVSMNVVVPDGQLLVVTEKGYGKRTDLEEYRPQGRGGKGIKAINQTARTGAVVGAKVVNEEDELMLITIGGVMIRQSVAEISVFGRNTQGVKLMRLEEDERAVAVALVAGKSED
ncbi:MAG: DNA gyrase subunit A [Firmicutes bacterium]|nr:DNA gyrase subunit A [Bacillota bacterium]